MSERVTIAFDSSDLSYATGGAASVSLTAREAALLLFVAYYLLRRGAWDNMTESEWDSLQNEIQDVIMKIKKPL